MSSRQWVRPGGRLFLLGFLTLYLELVLIRYLAGSIWNLGFFPNLVLLGAFVGMGVGFVFHQNLSAAQSRRVFEAVAPGLLGLVVFVALFHPKIPGFSERAGEVGGELYFTFLPESNVESSYAPFLLWLGAVVLLFAMISQRTAKLFATFPPLKAYTLDIAGSCCGIVSFMALSWLETPAYVWLVVLAPLLLLTPASWSGRGLAATAVLMVAVVVFRQDQSLASDPAYPGTIEVKWSPYQKVECTDGTGENGPTIYVNGIHHQGMRPKEWIARSIYQTPYTAEPGTPPRVYRHVLIMGAGSGNDVTAALLNGAEHVDAVEIDPVIARMGRRYHPARPYDDPRVRLTIDDARAFLTNTTETYDLIIFALTDSLIRISPMAQLRLENYLFTREAFARAYELLADDGRLVFYNYYRRAWLVEKLRRGIEAATGQAPRAIHLSKDFAVLAVDRQPRTAVASKPMAGATSRASASAVDVATDDWPFLYLRKRGVPAIYLAAIASFGLLVGGLALGIQRGGRRNRRLQQTMSGLPTKLAFALMGVAFLLLETKSVIQFSLLFGTTWLNNSLVFLGILLLILAANWSAYGLRGRWVMRATFVALLASSLATLVYPLSNLLYVQNAVLRFAGAALLTFSPIFFANLLFSLAFRDQPAAEHLFGWNLLGATLGGILEYSSMALGYNALSWIVACSYALAFALLLKDGLLSATPAAPVERERVAELVS